MKGRRRILVVEREPSLRGLIQDELGSERDVVTAASVEEGRSQLERGGADVVLVDLEHPVDHDFAALRAMAHHSPEPPGVVVLLAEHDRAAAGEAMRHGAYDSLVRPFSLDRLRAAVERAEERTLLLRENAALRQSVQASHRSQGLLGGSRHIADLKLQIEKVADSRGTVLLTGEPGTGKGLVARAIHQLSARRAGPFVKLNCSAVGEALLESELFGQQATADTPSAARKAGLLELADGGTLVLEDVGELPPGLQARLSRVLQEREVIPAGAKSPVRIDVRVVATSSRDLRALVREGRFKEELFYRLSVIPIEVLPLRARREDIPVLARHFVERACAENGRPLMHITAAAMEALAAYPWPGNVRELENGLERTVILNEGDSIDRDDLRLDDDAQLHRPLAAMDKDDLTLRELEKQLILRRLSLTGGNRTRAAALLGISVRTLRNKINQYRGEGIKIPG